MAMKVSFDSYSTTAAYLPVSSVDFKSVREMNP